MPADPSPQHRAVEAAVLAVGAAVLAGCTTAGERRPDPSPTPAPPHPDLGTLERALADEQHLVESYAATLPRVGGALRTTLAALQAHHVAHRDAVLAALVSRRPPTPSAPAPTASVTSTPATPTPATPAPVAATPVAATGPAALLAGEQASGQARVAAVTGATDPDVALLLAEVGASHAQHVVVLQSLG